MLRTEPDCRVLLQALDELGEPEPQAEPEPAAETREAEQDFTRIAPGLLDYPRTQAEPAHSPAGTSARCCWGLAACC